MKMPALIFTTTLTLILYFYPATIFAQDAGYAFNVTDGQAVPGDILINSKAKGIVRATQDYDKELFGILQSQPILLFKTKGSSGKPVVRTGVAEVNITTLGGAIAIGDYITSSGIAGKGQKANLSGYTIGIAMGAFDETSEGQKVTFSEKTYNSGKIPVALKIEYAEISRAKTAIRALDAINSAFFQNVQDPEKFVNVVRYFIAGLIAVGSFLVGFFTFAKSIPKGVEAVGRNPLAKNAIQMSMIMNIFFTLLATLVGIIASVLIIRL